MTITNEKEYEAAVVRAQELLGCLEDTPEDAELEALSTAIEDYEQRLASTSPRDA